MFEITPSSEFSAWFESLSPDLAEEVACAIDLLAVRGVALGPSYASRALLWFDGVGDGLPQESTLNRYLALSDQLATTDYVQELLLWQREIVRCLESERFRVELAQLDTSAALQALSAIESLKCQLRWALRRLRLNTSAQRSAARPMSWTGLTMREQRVLQQRLGIGESVEARLSLSLKEAFFELLQLVNLEPKQFMNSTSGLCELTLIGTNPRLRVLFGLDAAAERIVALLGEPLTRAYYGDSVRLAERRWREYCASGAQRRQSAKAV